MNSCACPNPPGGNVDCPDNHIAICRIRDGQVSGECIPPEPWLGAEAQLRRIVELVTERPLPFGPLPPAAEAVLASGAYTSPDGRMRVTFRRPRAEGQSSSEPMTRSE